MTDTNLAILLDRLVRRIHVSLHQKALEFDPDRIGPGGAMILLTLAEHDTLSMHSLTTMLVRDKSQMTRTVRPLERKGLIARAQAPHDSRVSLLSLTQKGQALVTRHEQALAQTIDETLSPLSTEDKQTLQDLLQRGLAAPAIKDRDCC